MDAGKLTEFSLIKFSVILMIYDQVIRKGFSCYLRHVYGGGSSEPQSQKHREMVQRHRRKWFFCTWRRSRRSTRSASQGTVCGKQGSARARGRCPKPENYQVRCFFSNLRENDSKFLIFKKTNEFFNSSKFTYYQTTY